MVQLARFLDLMDLEAHGESGFRAPPAPERGGRMYGGQLLAQGLLACQRTVPEDRPPHSLHAYFLRAGNTSDELDIQVDRVRDGRGFSARACSVTQAGRELFRLQGSFQVAEAGLEYDGPAAPTVPPADDVTLTYTAFQSGGGSGEGEFSGAVRPMDIRYVNPPPTDRTAVTEAQLLWMRIPEDLGPELVGPPGAIHAAALAYLADSTLIDHVVLPHGRRWQDGDLDTASLDHSMWFHRPVRADRWLLYEQFAEATGGGRGLARGRFFDAEKRLVATCMQEGLLRIQPPGADEG